MFFFTLRNFFKVPMRTIQLVLGSFIVIFLLFCAYAFQSGFEKSLRVSGEEKNVILLGIGSEESVERSEIALGAVSAVATIPGLKKQFNEIAVSPEVHYNTLIELDGEEKEILVRGVKHLALAVHTQVTVIQGSFPSSGEVMVGRFAWKKLGVSPGKLTLGQTIVFEKQQFRISGFFAAPGSTMESELWMNLGDISALTRRDSVSCIVVRTEQAEFADIDLFCKQRLDLQITAMRENNYYKKQDEFYQPIKIMAWLTAILIAIGALLGSANTFYAAVMNRKAEFAVLRVIGFSHTKLFTSLFVESLLFHLTAYFLAAVVALAFFPEIHLHFGSNFFSLTIGITELLHLLVTSIALAIFVIILPAINVLFSPLHNSLRS